MNSKNICPIDKSEIKSFLIKNFIDHYGGSSSGIIIAAAPGRINIIGEHLDYNGGYVLPAAINKELFIVMRKRADSKVFYYTAGGYQVESDLNDKLLYFKDYGYANYLNGMIKILKASKYEISSGFEIFIYSNLPQGAGLSSSAALQVCFGKAVAKSFCFDISEEQLAKLVQKNENEFLNLKCGIMDPFCIIFGKKDNALLLNSLTLDFDYIPLVLQGFKFVIINSNKERKLTGSKFNLRKTECEEGLRILQKKVDIDFLCEITEADFEYFQVKFFDETIMKRVRHCVKENARVHKAAEALKSGNIKELGRLLIESHISLRDDYESTGVELDAVFNAALMQKSCLGVKATGAGFGGCAVAIVEESKVEEFCSAVGDEYKRKTGLDSDSFVCSFSSGARII